MAVRAPLVVSPVRTATVMGGTARPMWRATAAISSKGRLRFCSMSTARALSGDTYTNRVPAMSSPASWAR